MNSYAGIPGLDTVGGYYPQYTQGYTPPMSNTVGPPINSAGIGGASSSSMSTVIWGLMLLGAAFLAMHFID